MPHLLDRLRERRGWLFDATCFVVGLSLVAWAVLHLARDGWQVAPVALLAVPLIAVIARFPIVIDEGDGGIEVGFDSAVLMLLVCTLESSTALTLWSLGVVVTQLVSSKLLSARIFNVGVGIIAGASATGVFHVVRGGDVSGPRELLAVALAATAYFSIDYVLSAASIALDTGTPLGPLLIQPGSWLAIGCFVPFDMLGYLGAVLLREAPWWTLGLLAVPLATLLIATRAVTHGRENARRLQVLLDAAVNAQVLSEPRQVLDVLLDDAQRLVRLGSLQLRPTPPGPSEVGAQVRGGEEVVWIVASTRARARSTAQADEQALAALAAVATAAFARLALTEDLVHLARYDPLTDLPNRAVFLDRLHYALHLARKRHHPVALLFIDLDGFKPINDRFGHAAGDAVLIDVAHRLRDTVRTNDTVARLGGDEFAVILEDVDLAEATAACRRILATLAGGVEASDHDVYVNASIGVAHGSGREQADEMLRNADLAMYEAKSRGRGRFVCYEPGMLTSRLDRLELVEALGEALEAGALTVVYQPVVLAETGRISGVEALARWRRGDVDVRPDVFIKLAEETGLIAAVGAAVLDQVGRDAAAIRDAYEDINIAVNVSPTQLAEPEFVERVRDTMHLMGSAGLVLEITEREGLSHDASVLRTMQRIADMGVVFAIDDFGVGFSSISYLQEVPARIVKVDASLSQHIDRSDQARSLLQSITMMAQALGLDLVIEGVERESQLSLVREDAAGAYAQGYFIHRPMPLPALLEVIRLDRLSAQSAAAGDAPRPISSSSSSLR
ncbi:MAG: EAL domain-containing protein [Nocardioides sp.]|nr:EAL domain-containing protein [Nocardioides sp.]